MSENPYARTAAWFAAYRRELNSTVPTLAMVHHAFECDEIDVVDFERLVEAALTGTRVELPERMARMRLAR